ncbi:cytochrome P450 4C1-like [Plodia interpunctella]|uniref:cytochrome P450 4C1-like n=1 Tax=Plodia interpunctella TaxID=58824 RepID=UPI0023682B62|nr:cytochrome P450 4C1-like [Plodia interpunctella]XP_053617403.1 cytochrome P450 4C1-like [Plodia interpunctella]
MFEDCFKVSLPVLMTAVVILSSLLYWQYWRWTHRRMLELAKLVPGPPALPIIGNALIFMTKPEEQLKKIAGILDMYGQYARVWLGPDLNIVVKNPTDVRLLLTSNKVNQKGPLYDFMKPFIGPGILTGGPSWRNHRKIANPSYSKKSVHHYTETFNREATELVKVLLGKDPGVTFDLYSDMVQCTTQCVCQTLMGLSKEDSQNVLLMDDVVQDTQRIYDMLFKKMTRWWLQIPFINWLSGNLHKEKQILRMLDTFTSDILQKRRRALKVEDLGEDVMGIVDRYILSGELTDQEIKWETFTLFTTSQEASAKIASGVLLFLAYLPEWQDKVYNEIVELLGAEDEPVTEKQVKELQHLDMVFKETLRYFSIAAMTQRTVEEEITINNGKITLPAGTSLVIPIHEIHRDPQYWDEPLKVKPERFLPQNIGHRDPNAFVPFSLGPMDCLGRVYATALIKIIVVVILRAVRVEARGSPHDLPLNVAISVKPAGGYLLTARPRRTTNGLHRSL